MTLTRQEFQKAVFDRDKRTCVIPWCSKPAVDAHHIMERALWLADDPYKEGYHIANGASVCEEHHLACECNAIPPQALRRWLDLETVLPQQLDKNKIWNKWGEPIPMSLRLKAKYPSTPYLPISETQDGRSDIIDPEVLLNRPLIFTIKMDGSNVTLTNEEVAARNGQLASHQSFDYLKALHAQFKEKIPAGIQLFGEWLYAKHSIEYQSKLALKSYLQLFAVYEQSIQLFWPWDEVMDFAAKRDFHCVPVLEVQTFDRAWRLLDFTHKISKAVIKDGHEGIVVKSSYPYHYGQHGENVAKYVRPNHIQTDTHWSAQPIIKNEIV